MFCVSVCARYTFYHIIVIGSGKDLRNIFLILWKCNFPLPITTCIVTLLDNDNLHQIPKKLSWQMFSFKYFINKSKKEYISTSQCKTYLPTLFDICVLSAKINSKRIKISIPTDNFQVPWPFALLVYFLSKSPSVLLSYYVKYYFKINLFYFVKCVIRYQRDGIIITLSRYLRNVL